MTDEVLGLYAVLEQLLKLVHGDDDTKSVPRFETAKLLGNCQGPLADCQAILVQLKAQAAPSSTDSRTRTGHLLWPFKEAEFKRTLESIRHARQNLVAALRN